MSEQPYDPAAHPYPKIRYHAIHGEKRVENDEEDQALGPGWIDTPNIPEGFLRDCGELSESKAQREDEIRQACEAFDQRLKKRASRESVKRDTPIWLIAIDSLEEELKDLAFRVIEVYLKSWEKCEQSMDSQKDKWFREGLLEYIVKDRLAKELELLEQGYRKQLPPREKVDQRCEQLDKVGASVIHWARGQVFHDEFGSEGSRREKAEPEIRKLEPETIQGTVDGKEVQVPKDWRERLRITYAQAAVLLSVESTRTIQSYVKNDTRLSSGTGFINVSHLLKTHLSETKK